jgi:hypothetical protein
MVSKNCSIFPRPRGRTTPELIRWIFGSAVTCSRWREVNSLPRSE